MPKDIREYLKSKGVSDEDMKIMTEPMLNALAAVAQEAEEGRTAYERAEAVKADVDGLKSKWSEYVRTRDEETASARAEIAKQKGYMAEMKKAGYDIPDAWLGETTDVEKGSKAKSPIDPSPARENGIDVGKELTGFASDWLELQDLADDYREMTGKRLSINSEYKSFRENKDRRPSEGFKQYIERKYDMDKVRQETTAKKQKEHEDSLIARGRKEAEEELAKRYSSNPETRALYSPKFSKHIEAQRAEREAKPAAAAAESTSPTNGRSMQTWQSPRLRSQSAAQRVEKYSEQVRKAALVQ